METKFYCWGRSFNLGWPCTDSSSPVGLSVHMRCLLWYEFSTVHNGGEAECLNSWVLTSVSLEIIRLLGFTRSRRACPLRAKREGKIVIRAILIYRQYSWLTFLGIMIGEGYDSVAKRWLLQLGLPSNPYCKRMHELVSLCQYHSEPYRSASVFSPQPTGHCNRGT